MRSHKPDEHKRVTEAMREEIKLYSNSNKT